MSQELYHYGIKGMKWGVRRTEAQLARAKGSKKEDISSMSDDELRRRVNRLNMEQQYKKLTESSTSKGADYMKKIYKAGTTVAAVTTTALTLYNNADKIKKIVEKMVTK